jgi:hypothetical protein
MRMLEVCKFHRRRDGLGSDYAIWSVTELIMQSSSE